MSLKECLIENNYSIVCTNGYTSSDSGIRPVILPMCEKIDFFKDEEVADKLIGKASAMLLVLSGVKKVYTPLISKAGMETFDRFHIPYEYDETVDFISNMKGDGMCPMEMTVQDIDDPKEAFEALKKKLSLQ